MSPFLFPSKSGTPSRRISVKTKGGNDMKELFKKLSWTLFVLKYKLGLAKEGVDFITSGLE